MTMNLRDYFAAFALQGLASQPKSASASAPRAQLAVMLDEPEDNGTNRIAERAYELADAMLAVRARTKPEQAPTVATGATEAQHYTTT